MWRQVSVLHLCKFAGQPQRRLYQELTVTVAVDRQKNDKFKRQMASHSRDEAYSCCVGERSFPAPQIEMQEF
jgi:hypothetical protein